ncbi:MAG: hypothetical protein AAGE59_09540, partial [Cyanobacteria bacterium P01_F01_bin.86]
SEYGLVGEVSILPAYADSVKWEGPLWRSGFTAAYERSNAVRIRNATPNQSLYARGGFDIEAELYLRDAHQDNFCTSLASFSANLRDISSQYFKADLVTIYQGGETCSVDGANDPDMLYFVVADSLQNPVAVEANDFLEQWATIGIEVSSSFEVTLSLGETELGTASATGLRLLDPEFIYLYTYGQYETYVSNITLLSKNQMNSDRPFLPYFWSYKYNGNMIQTNWNAESSGNTIQIKVFRLANSDLVEGSQLETEVNATDDRPSFEVPENGSYGTFARECSGVICSPYKFDRVSVTGFIERPVISLDTTENQAEIAVTWLPVEDALRYVVYLNNREFGETTDTDFVITGIRQERNSVYVAACSATLCNNSYSRHIILDLDSDGDGISDVNEFRYGTDPFESDTDGDGLSDFDEVMVYNTSPLVSDTDGDGVSDADEILSGADPLINETCPAYLCGSKYKGWRAALLKNQNLD